MTRVLRRSRTLPSKRLRQLAPLGSSNVASKPVVLCLRADGRGPTRLRRQVPQWLQLSYLAAARRPA